MVMKRSLSVCVPGRLEQPRSLAASQPQPRLWFTRLRLWVDLQSANATRAPDPGSDRGHHLLQAAPQVPDHAVACDLLKGLARA